MSQKRDEFVTRLRPVGAALVILARRLVAERCDAEDVLQAALGAAWGRYAAGEDVDNFRAWISQFVVLEARNHARRRSRRQRCQTDLADDIAERETPSGIAGLLEAEIAYESCRTTPQALAEMLEDELVSALDSLSEEERAAFLLKALFELRCSEIAEQAQVPEGTIMARIHRAREKLRLRLMADRTRDSRSGELP
ncbi:MAG: RNA polymerase sigma factor [Planctomycetota bacterium]